MAQMIRKKEALNIIIIVLVSLGVLVPISSNQFMPNITDFVTHSGLIVQAKKALFTGDFPIRVAPWQHHGYQYPEFQFYSPFPFTIAAIVYGVFLSFNVYLALKVMYFFILIFAGIYAYRLGYLITKSKEIGTLIAVSYIVSPYFLVNILARSAFTEAFAQGLIPFCLFHTFKFFNEEITIKRFLLVALAWFMLATSHLITYVNTSIFIGLLVLGFWVLKLQTFKKIMLYGASYFYSILLCAWFFVPIMMFKNELHVTSYSNSLYETAWLTPISELLSFKSVSMMPLPGNGLLESAVYPSLGWITILSILGLWYVLSNENEYVIKFEKKIGYLLVFLFLLTVFLAWSPFNFWKFLPSFFQLTQFTYRYLSQSMWIGMLLMALFLSCFEKPLNILHLFIGVLIILLTNSSWIHSLNSIDLHPKIIPTSPSIGGGANDYLLEKHSNNQNFSNIEIPLKSSDCKLITNKKVIIDNGLFDRFSDVKLHMEGKNTLENNLKLSIKVNNQIVGSQLIKSNNFNYDISLKVPKNSEKNKFSLELFLSKSPEDNQVNDETGLPLLIDKIYFINPVLEKEVMKAEVTNQSCQLNKLKHEFSCDLNVSKQQSLVQLPLLFYPKMLKIVVDSHLVGENYFSSDCGNYQCATLNLLPGKHHVQFKFTGISWSNKLSLIAWILFVGILVIRRYKKNNIF